MAREYKRLLPLALCAALAACSFTPRHVPVATPGKVKTVPAKQGGGYYKDDGPGAEIPVGLDNVPDAIPRAEPLHRAANRPYTVLGKNYVPQTQVKPFRQEGVASWYGKKFHGQKTSIGETYDMFAMTAAHTTLPLPSYARVSNPANGRSVVVRVNDRGPFHAGRIIDLSYTAAYKLGYIDNGSSKVIVETIIPGASLPTPIVPPAPAPPVAVIPPASDEFDALALRLQREEAAAATEHGVFLQLGAFANPENAENLKNHLARDLEDIADPIFIYSDGKLNRLQMGPYPDRDAAQQVAQKIRDLLGNAPTLVFR
ncbi:MAG: septal ring lytic transglycosylase RlpA family protein [Zoogloeaceae bacterium]|nr:septal ring lytic transglycosylase RlpA family protein [Zoogloeaceae bacterium]